MSYFRKKLLTIVSKNLVIQLSWPVFQEVITLEYWTKHQIKDNFVLFQKSSDGYTDMFNGFWGIDKNLASPFLTNFTGYILQNTECTLVILIWEER